MKTNTRAFTLIELMIVVAIIGILASVAIPSFLKFIKQAKTTEMPINLRAIANGALAWINDNHADSNGNPMAEHYPNSSSPTGYPPDYPSSDNVETPAPSPCLNPSISSGALYHKNTAHWNIQPWVSLKFSVTKAHYYQYSFNTNNTGHPAIFGADAKSDFDCDSTYAIWTIVGERSSATKEVELHQISLVPGSGDALE